MNPHAPHRMAVEDIVDTHAPELMSDERDDLLAALYAWRDEALADQGRVDV